MKTLKTFMTVCIGMFLFRKYRKMRTRRNNHLRRFIGDPFASAGYTIRRDSPLNARPLQEPFTVR